jgi:hypothetical protein
MKLSQDFFKYFKLPFLKLGAFAFSECADSLILVGFLPVDLRVSGMVLLMQVFLVC